MGLLDCTDLLEQESYLGEALFLCGLCKFGIHIGPLEVFAFSGSCEVGSSLGNIAVVQELEPNLGMLLLVLCGLLEDVRYLYVAVFLGLGSEIEILGVGLGFTRKRGLQVLFGL